MDFLVPYEYKKIFSTEHQAKQINNILLKFANNEYIITDATSCIGGNSFFFAQCFKYVNCIELNEKVFEILKTNMSNFTNKTLYNCSYNILKNILRQDIIFLDPPWGGSIYKSKKKIDLYLDNTNILDIINSLYNNTRLIALKVPNNYNKSSIPNNFWKFKIFSINKNQKSIYKLIIFYK